MFHATGREQKWKRRWHKFAVCVNLCYARAWRTHHCILHLRPEIILNAQTPTFLSACMYMRARVSSPPNGFHVWNIFILGKAAQLVCWFLTAAPQGDCFCKYFACDEIWITQIPNAPPKLLSLQNKYQKSRKECLHSMEVVACFFNNVFTVCAIFVSMFTDTAISWKFLLFESHAALLTFNYGLLS